MEKIIIIRNKFLEFFYVNILKRIFFKIDPEVVHDGMISFGKKMGRFSFFRKLTALFFDYKNDFLRQKIVGIEFSNPIGLAAGFDKNAELLDIIPSVGFGYVEVGSITGKPCAGNAKPRLWRLKKSRSIAVYFGLKNEGCEIIAERLKNKKISIPIGISIAQTNDLSIDSLKKGIDDYLKSYRIFKDIGDYYTINISCPNMINSCSFLDIFNLEKLLEAVYQEKNKKPIFLKISPDLEKEKIDQIIELAKKYGVDGFICSNLAKKRDKVIDKIIDSNVPEKGGLSGKIAEELANELLEYIYLKTKGKFVLIGCGGIFSAEDAYRKIKLGASLVQLITGMIFEGPQLISSINLNLAKLLKKDGYTSITEAIGTEAGRSVK